MARIVPNIKRNKRNSKPDWLDTDKLRESTQGSVDGIKEAMTKTSSQVSKPENNIVVSYGCRGCNTKYSADSQHIKAQSNILQRKGRDPETFVKEASAGAASVFTCKKCGGALYVKDTMPNFKRNKEVRYADTVEGNRPVVSSLDKKSGGYNTYVDRHIVYKAVDGLTRFAMKTGMFKPRVRFLRAEYKKGAGQEYSMLNDLHCEIEWASGKDVNHRVFATVKIDGGGKIKMPPVFKDASGKDYPFDKDSVKEFEQRVRHSIMERRGPRKTDVPTFRPSDPSRFRAHASQEQQADVDAKAQKKTNFSSDDADDIVDSLVSGAAYTPAAPPPDTATPMGDQQQVQPGQQVVNPVDNKTYDVKDVSPEGYTVVDTETQHEAFVPQDRAQNLKPVIQTSKPVKVSAIIDDLVNDVFENVKPPVLANTQSAIAQESKSKSGKRWQEHRAGIKTRAQQQAEYAKGDKKPDVDSTGHDKRTNLPFPEGSDGSEVEVGLTEFPKDQERHEDEGYGMSFQEMDEKHVAERERFNNERRLPIRNMQRRELKDMIDGEEGEFNTGLAREERQALLDAVAMNKYAYLDDKVAQEEGEEREFEVQPPTEIKDVGRRPEQLEEPDVIPEAKGTLKGLITKVHTVYSELEDTKALYKEKMEAFQSDVERAREKHRLPGLEEEMKAYADTIADRMQSIYDGLVEAGGLVKHAIGYIGAYEQEVARKGQVSVPQVIKYLEEKGLDEVAAQVKEARKAIESDKTKYVRQQFVVRLPETEERAKRTASLETELAEDLINDLSEVAKGLASATTALQAGLDMLEFV